MRREIDLFEGEKVTGELGHVVIIVAVIAGRALRIGGRVGRGRVVGVVKLV